MWDSRFKFTTSAQRNISDSICCEAGEMKCQQLSYINMICKGNGIAFLLATAVFIKSVVYQVCLCVYLCVNVCVYVCGCVHACVRVRAWVCVLECLQAVGPL